MQNPARQIEAAEFPLADLQNLDSFTSHTRPHWSRKQGSSLKLTSSASSVMVEPLQAADRDPLKKKKGHYIRNIDRGSFDDAVTILPERTTDRKELAKKRSQYYDDAFAVRESNSSARERIHRESIVMVEVRTNVIVKDEYTFITDLSYNLASRYQRPESSILVILSHSVCLFLGASFDPAYTMTITALPSQVQPITNKRNSILLAKLLEESLSVPSSRGIIRFVGVQEENFALNGKTIAAEIEDLERTQTDDNTTVKRDLSRTEHKITANRQSKRSMSSLKVDIASANRGGNANRSSSPNIERSRRSRSPQIERSLSLRRPITPAPLPDRFNMTPAIPMPPVPTKKTALGGKAEKVQKLGHRKSFISSLFGKQNGW